jgi:hypothetical protein
VNPGKLGALVALVGMAACTDFEAPKRVALPDVVVANPQFAKDVQPIFSARCATSSCHTFATHQAGLNLAPGYAYDEIVNVPSVFRPSWKRIVPAKADSSFLIKTLLANDAEHPEIDRMPLGREPLTDNQIQTIINWVNQGAVRN